MITGTVVQVMDHGTIVQVLIRNDAGVIHPVNFDHRQFWHMYEAEGTLVGRKIAVENDEEAGQVVRFLA